jgi:hypothetical protein
MADFVWAAGADMMGRRQSRARIGVKRVVDFRRKWANKSDRAINAVVSHFWNKLKATSLQREKNGPRNQVEREATSVAAFHLDVPSRKLPDVAV